MRYITRTVWILSIVSLLTDVASEMLYPVMPIYLRQIGFSILLIGILEGLTEATAGLSKGYFGKLSDLSARRVPFIQAGYALSAMAKPMLGLFTCPWWIFFLRTAERVGKGIRTGARDAMLSDVSSQGNKAKVFGFHRSFDTLGAVLGPSLALLYLHFRPEDYRSLFFIAFAPGILAIAVSGLLKEKRLQVSFSLKKVSFFSFLRYWKQSPTAYKRIVLGLLLFTLFNSSDVFLLLKIKEAGLGDSTVIGVYIFYNLIYALFSFPMGALADRIGLKVVFILGLILFAFVYTGMALGNGLWFYLILFFIYGIYAASTEGISKAWISMVIEKKDTATAIGTFTAFQSICTMIASSLAGAIWFVFGPTAAFLTTAAVTVVVIVYFLVIATRKMT